ncbi:MAG TPA: hypothetical protein EYM27_08785, partial [Dehalococcoidia bacterium]|nr:hypothetical protein [Dehalococcoidia bacterium]
MPNPTKNRERQADDLPLSGLEVVEVAQGVAGPFCGRLLAALGANVIKVERPPIGDWSRKIAPFLSDDNHPESSALYLYNNTGKKSVLIDWETESGIDTLTSLVSKADVLIEDWDVNYRESAGLSTEKFNSEN